MGEYSYDKYVAKDERQSSMVSLILPLIIFVIILMLTILCMSADSVSTTFVNVYFSPAKLSTDYTSAYGKIVILSIVIGFIPVFMTCIKEYFMQSYEAKIYDEKWNRLENCYVHYKTQKPLSGFKLFVYKHPTLLAWVLRIVCLIIFFRLAKGIFKPVPRDFANVYVWYALPFINLLLYVPVCLIYEHIRKFPNNIMFLCIFYTIVLFAFPFLFMLIVKNLYIIVGIIVLLVILGIIMVATDDTVNVRVVR